MIDSPLQSRSRVTDALSTRRTVRLTYFRRADRYTIDVVCGDDVLSEQAVIDGRVLGADELAESWATRLATAMRLDVSRVDVE